MAVNSQVWILLFETDQQSYCVGSRCCSLLSHSVVVSCCVKSALVWLYRIMMLRVWPSSHGAAVSSPNQWLCVVVSSKARQSNAKQCKAIHNRFKHTCVRISCGDRTSMGVPWRDLCLLIFAWGACLTCLFNLWMTLLEGKCITGFLTSLFNLRPKAEVAHLIVSHYV